VSCNLGQDRGQTAVAAAAAATTTTTTATTIEVILKR